MKINESTLRRIIREELFSGLDALLQWRSKFENVLETVLMDLEDMGCPSNDPGYKKISDALDALGRVRISRDEDPTVAHDQMMNVVSAARGAVKTCSGIGSSEARKIRDDILSALTEYSDWVYSPDSGLKIA